MYRFVVYLISKNGFEERFTSHCVNANSEADAQIKVDKWLKETYPHRRLKAVLF